MPVSIQRDVSEGTGAGTGRHRLGLDQPAGWWPTASRLKSYEAAGFDYVQVRMPPRGLLADGAAVGVHASALRAVLTLTRLRLILHAPDDLLAGSPEHDLQLAGALEYALVAGAELVVYHGLRVPVAGGGARERLADEEHSLRRLLRSIAGSDLRLAIENLAPVYPGGREYVCHDPAVVASLSARLDSARVGMCLDLGHAHIAAGLAGCPLVELVAPVLDQVILFHIHDNFGVRGATPHAGGIDPFKLDLHLAPGAGTVPWPSLRALLEPHDAPMQLEIHPARRPEPATLAVLTREVLGLLACKP